MLIYNYFTLKQYLGQAKTSHKTNPFIVQEKIVRNKNDEIPCDKKVFGVKMRSSLSCQLRIETKSVTKLGMSHFIKTSLPLITWA